MPKEEAFSAIYSDYPRFASAGSAYALCVKGMEEYQSVSLSTKTIEPSEPKFDIRLCFQTVGGEGSHEATPSDVTVRAEAVGPCEASHTTILAASLRDIQM